SEGTPHVYIWGVPGLPEMRIRTFAEFPGLGRCAFVHLRSSRASGDAHSYVCVVSGPQELRIRIFAAFRATRTCAFAASRSGAGSPCPARRLQLWQLLLGHSGLGPGSYPLSPELRLPLLPAGHDVEAFLSTLAKAVKPAPAELGQLDEVAVRVSDCRHAHTADLLRLVKRLDAPLGQGLEVGVEVEDYEGQLDRADADIGVALEVVA